MKSKVVTLGWFAQVVLEPTQRARQHVLAVRRLARAQEDVRAAWIAGELDLAAGFLQAPRTSARPARSGSARPLRRE